MRILITGAAGVYGAHLARLCLDRGDEVFSLRHSDRPNDCASLLGVRDKITWVRGNMLDGELLLQALASWNIQAFVHAAALPIVSTAPSMLRAVWSTNVDGTVAALEAVRQYKPDMLFLYISTDKAIGTQGDRPYTEDMAPRPEAPYDASKYAAEVACRSYQKMGYVPNLVVTRSCNIIAPGDLNFRLVSNTIRQFMCHVPAKVYSRGQFVREFIAVEDAVEAQLLCLLRADETPGETFHIGSGTQLTQEEVIEYVRATHFPAGHVILVEPPPYSKIEIPYQALDSTKIRQRHGWAPKLSVFQAIDRVAAWWKERPQLAPWSLL